MKIKKEILYFIISLTAISVLRLLFLNFNLIAGNTWSALFFVSILTCIYFSGKLLIDFEFENIYFKGIFGLLMLYHVVIIVRGLPTNYEDIKSTLQYDFLLWPLLVPLFIFFDKKLDTIVQLFKSMYYLCILFLIISIAYPSLIINRPTAETFILPFAFGSGFLIMNARYLSNKKALISLLVCTVAVLSFTYLARRNAIVTFSGFMVAALFLYMEDLSFSKLIKIFPFLTLLFILIFIFSDEIPSSFTSRLTDRAKEDTRSDLFEAFDKSMRDDLIIGKGMNGTYYFPIKEAVLDDGGTMGAAEYRKLIENGYMQLILMGGYVEVILFMLVLIPAAFLGIFKSSNNLARSCGILIVLWLIDMAIFGLPRLYIQYICVWICVGISYKKSFRQLTDDIIYDEFNKIALA